jgi:hypothetical protein
VVDTNVLLHCLPLDQIPWPTIVESEAVELVIVAQVLRELDDKKNGDSEKLKKRAKRALASLNGWLPPRTASAEIADGVRVRVLPAEPSERPGFDFAVSDDRILASAVDLSSDADVCVATGDTSMRFKAEHHGLAVYIVPEAYRVREEEAKKEIRHSPRLIAGLFEAERGDVKTNIAVKLGLSVRHLLPDAEEGLIEARRRETEEEERENMLNSARENGGSFGSPFGPKHRALMRGIRKASALYSRNPFVNEPTAQSWERYVQRLVAFDEEHHKTARIDIGIANQGSAPADDVIVEFRFPVGVDVSLREPRVPEEPQGEQRPDLSVLVASRLSVDTAQPHTIEVETQPNGACVRIRVKRLMHSRTVVYPVWLHAEGGFTIRALTLAASPPVHEKADLNVRFTAS